MWRRMARAFPLRLKPTASSKKGSICEPQTGPTQVQHVTHLLRFYTFPVASRQEQTPFWTGRAPGSCSISIGGLGNFPVGQYPALKKSSRLPGTAGNYQAMSSNWASLRGPVRRPRRPPPLTAASPPLSVLWRRGSITPRVNGAFSTAVTASSVDHYAMECLKSRSSWVLG